MVTHPRCRAAVQIRLRWWEGRRRPRCRRRAPKTDHPLPRGIPGLHQVNWVVKLPCQNSNEEATAAIQCVRDGTAPAPMPATVWHWTWVSATSTLQAEVEYGSGPEAPAGPYVKETEPNLWVNQVLN